MKVGTTKISGVNWHENSEDQVSRRTSNSADANQKQDLSA